MAANKTAANKKYTCPMMGFGLYVVVNGKEVSVDFKPVDRNSRSQGSVFYTDNAALQKAIENSHHFGTRIFAVPRQEKDTKTAATAPNVPSVPSANDADDDKNLL
jgi:hypothetical protein